MHDLVPNVNSIYNVSNKRVKRNLDSTYLWHCRLAHINKKRIKQLQQDGLLKSTDDESFDKCESCLSGKMTKKPFPHSNERAKDLLGIIHTDVCGPLRHVSRQGASYFITFTDDYSRYGYVYLLKHKHEVFETFKVFKNEVENQLGKTIKAIRSDRGGEYISQEFKGCQDLYVEFFEKRLISQEISRRAVDLEEIQEEEEDTTPLKSGTFLKRSERTHRAPNRLCLNVEVEEHSLGDLGEPANYKAAMLDPESKKWVDAMNAEMQSMIDNMVWVLVDLPPNCKTVRSKWIFKKKTDMDGNVHIYKARLVAKAAFYDYEIWQMDVKTAFLNGYLDEDIYMVQNLKNYLGKCFSMKDLGEAAFILGIKIYRDRSKRLIGLSQNAYMDKILKRYKMDNSKRGTIPMQERLDLNKSQGAQTPKEVNRMKNVPYASAVGSIMYAVRCTRPDVAFAQNLTSRFQQNPGELHWTAVKNILKYLRNTKDMFLVYGGNPSTELRVECYCDAGFETDRDDTKSQTGYVFVLNGGAVDWKSSKQSTIAMSATESEYIAASEAAMEAVWIRKFISGLGIVPTINEPLNMYCDNSAAIHYANESGVQRGARHYHRRYHYVRECVELGEIRILKVYTDNNLADPFTKALSNRKLINL
ncbi:retrotransposon protein, putative, ty1-copia subclass [Tanacetum coccineum]